MMKIVELWCVDEKFRESVLDNIEGISAVEVDIQHNLGNNKRSMQPSAELEIIHDLKFIYEHRSEC